jgi:hypothetical protein
MPDIATHLDPRLLAVDVKDLLLRFRECTPRILVVTDGLNYSAADGFGLSQFVASLTAATIHGMTPIVVKASRGGSAGADINGFDFNDATRGLDIKRYDVLFLFGIWTEGTSDLPAAERDTIVRFMQAGGGVFATGDHETLGASLCSEIPRVRAMRKWKNVDAPPHVSSLKRHSTNWSGIDETEVFADQSDAFTQRLYVNYNRPSPFIWWPPGVDRAPHPVLQMVSPRKVLEVFPDHPHEGECVLPKALSGTFSLNGKDVPEWPKTFFLPPRPEMAAYSMSHGDGFEFGETDKLGLTPKAFGAIAAYNGQRAGVGRVVTDSTWHHFVNINLDGTDSGQSALRPGGVDSEDLVRIRQYYVNLATWLMPAKVRRCLFIAQTVAELARFPLREELQMAKPLPFDADTAQAMGARLLDALRQHQPLWVADALADDALTDAVGDKQRAQLDDADAAPLLRDARRQMAEAAVGGYLAGVIGELNQMKSLDQMKPHESFVNGAAKGAAQAVKLTLDRQREQVARLEKMLGVAQR